MWKKVALASFFLWGATLSYLGYKFIKGNAVQVDNRVEIRLSEGDRDIILGEMRTLLEGLKGILKGLSLGDKTFIEKAARGNGMAMAQDVNPALIMKLPKSFKTLGMSVHKDFDELADKVHGMNDKEVLNFLDTTMNKCVSCHRMYRLTSE